LGINEEPKVIRKDNTMVDDDDGASTFGAAVLVEDADADDDVKSLTKSKRRSLSVAGFTDCVVHVA
jgi:hypothetical protein